MTAVGTDHRASALQRIATICSSHRYLLLGAVLVVGVGAQALNEQWSSDVFEHLAVVRELVAHPFDPSHPILPIETAHPFYSPYTVSLGLVGNLSGAGPVTLLQFAAVANATLLLVAYRRFVLTVSQQRNAEFFGLLAVLLLWGPTAWRLSGFLNLSSIGYGMPYPSAFATALMLFALAETDLLLREGMRPRRLVLLALLVATILLTHPITGIATVTGLVGFWFGRGRLLPRRSDLPLFAALVAAVVLVTIWPYYSFWRLLADNSDYVSSHGLLYEGLPVRIAPLIVLAVLLALGRPNLRAEPLLAWATLGAVLYVVGATTGQSVLGRSLAFIALATLTKVGVVVAGYLERPAPGRERVLAIVAGIMAAGGLLFASAALLRMVPRPILPSDLATDERLAPASGGTDFLTELVPDDAVVAAFPYDLSDVTPAFAGKVASTPKPMPFVDEAPREVLVGRLFGNNVDLVQRQQLVTDNGIDFLLFDDRAVSRRTNEELRRLGTVVHVDDHVVLVSTAG